MVNHGLSPLETSSQVVGYVPIAHFSPSSAKTGQNQMKTRDLLKVRGSNTEHTFQMYKELL
jgi:hypothetical protein